MACHEKANRSIQCSVSNCAYHCGGENYCTRNEIQVGCDQSTVGSCQETQCVSFQLGNPSAKCGCE